MGRHLGMEVVVLAVVLGLAALFVGFLLGAKASAKAVAPALIQVSNTQAIDRANFLLTLRRELANMLVWRNPQRYLQLYRQLNSEVSALTSWRFEEVSKRLATLCSKYPNYSDFDAIGTREYVLYADGASSMDDDELEERYKDLIMFAALSSIADANWKDAAAKRFVHTTDDEELAHLTEYVQRIEDTKLRLRIKEAMDYYYLARRNNAGNFGNDLHSFTDLPHFAETRLGIHLKRSNEFAIYSFFVFDDGRISSSYYRSDPSFQHEKLLSPLRAVLDELGVER